MKFNVTGFTDMNDLKSAPKLADDTLRSSLQLISDEHQEQDDSLRLEQQRLSLKYGQDSRQAKDAAARFEAHQQMRLGIKVHLERSQVQTPPRSTDNFIVYGRVIQDTDGEGVGGLIVAVIDSRSQPVAQDKTDARGNFQLIMAATATLKLKDQAQGVIKNEVAAPPTEASVQLRLQVSDASKKRVYEDTEPFSPSQGRLSYREIILSAQIPAATVRPSKNESRARGKTESVRRGRS